MLKYTAAVIFNDDLKFISSHNKTAYFELIKMVFRFLGSCGTFVTRSNSGFRALKVLLDV